MLYAFDPPGSRSGTLTIYKVACGDAMASDKYLRPIGSAHCREYATDANFFIHETPAFTFRILVVQYADGRREFVTGIPPGWSDEDVQTLILQPTTDSKYPAWEIPSCVHGSPMLFRYWAGEKPMALR